MIQLDLNNPEFQANLLALAKPDACQLETVAVLKTLRLLQARSWEQLQSSKGLRWKLIQSRQGPAGSGCIPCGSAAAAGLWPGAMATGCGCSRSTPITTLPIDAASAAQGEAPPARLGIWGRRRRLLAERRNAVDELILCAKKALCGEPGQLTAQGIISESVLELQAHHLY